MRLATKQSFVMCASKRWSIRCTARDASVAFVTIEISALKHSAPEMLYFTPYISDFLDFERDTVSLKLKLVIGVLINSALEKTNETGYRD